MNTKIIKTIKAGAHGKILEVTTEAVHKFEGTVVVTDPCYFMPEDVWIDLCDKIFFEDKNATPFTNTGTIYYEGAKILYTSTHNGDGGYGIEPMEGILQGGFGVDSGTMAVITLEDLRKISDDELSQELYAVVENFSGEIEADKNGNFIGDLEVYTDESQNKDDFFDEDEDEWEDDKDYENDNNDW